MTGPSNPWQQLEIQAQPPYVLSEDGQAIDEINIAAEERHKIRLEIFPEPFLGNPDAPVVLLNLNPGFKDRDLTHHANDAFKKRSMQNLLHKPVEYPFYLIDPELRPVLDRTDWWDKKLGRLIEFAGRHKVASRVLCVEYFPYHSPKFGHKRLRLPSQDYSFHLVRQAIARGALLLMMRSVTLWFNAVRELASYSRLHIAWSVQNPAISPGNFPTGFWEALDTL